MGRLHLSHYRFCALVLGLFVCMFVGCGNRSRGTEDRPQIGGAAANNSTRQESPRPTSPVGSSNPTQTQSQEQSSATTAEQTKAPALAPSRKKRPADRRPTPTPAALEAARVRRLSGQRLVLYTDVPGDELTQLPGLVDQLYAQLSDYFGPPPTAADDSEFQLNGYLMQDEARFRELGLIPPDLPLFEHGGHREYEFWLRDQATEYFRRHLLFHEVAHCFMTIAPQTEAPLWYHEGMAEVAGTHQLDARGQVRFGVMPTAAREFRGHGRIELIQRANAAGQGLSLQQVTALPAARFRQPEAYAWSWAFCHFLQQHPRHQAEFQRLGQSLALGEFPANWTAFLAEQPELAAEWLLFSHQLVPGYDTTRATVTLAEGVPLGVDESQVVTINADQGWQSTGIQVTPGTQYRIRATGQSTLAERPQPWRAEPDGISIRYVDEWPIGRLLGCLYETQPTDEAIGESLLRVIDLGADATWQPTRPGTLYLRINDAWSELADNQGAYQVTLERLGRH